MKNKEIHSLYLPPVKIEYFKYFISEYNKYIKTGEIDMAKHCAEAVLLGLEEMLPADNDERDGVE